MAATTLRYSLVYQNKTVRNVELGPPSVYSRGVILHAIIYTEKHLLFSLGLLGGRLVLNLSVLSLDNGGTNNRSVGDIGVELSDDGVNIVNVERSDVSELLDLGSDILALGVSQVQVELVNSRLDGVPAGQTVGKVDVSGQTEIGGVENLVGGGVGKDGLGVDTGLVGEGTETSDGVVEGDVDLDGISDKVLEVSQLVQLVLGENVVSVSSDHSSHQTSERGDTVSLTDSENGDIDEVGAGLESGVGVGNGTAGIVVEMALNVTRDDGLEGSDKLVDLSGVGTSDGIGNTDSVDTNLVDGSVNVEEIDQVGSERVLRGESDLDTVALDKLDDLDGGLCNVVHVLTVGVLSQELGGTNDDIDTVNTGGDGESCVVHVASDVSENLGLKTELADGLAIGPRLLRCCGGGQLDVVNTKVIKGLGNLDLGLGVEEGRSKLLSLSQSGLDELELGDVGQEIRGVGSVGIGLLSGVTDLDSDGGGLLRSSVSGGGVICCAHFYSDSSVVLVVDENLSVERKKEKKERLNWGTSKSFICSMFSYYD